MIAIERHAYELEIQRLKLGLRMIRDYANSDGHKAVGDSGCIGPLMDIYSMAERTLNGLDPITGKRMAREGEGGTPDASKQRGT